MKRYPTLLAAFEAAGVSQQAYAERLGISQPYLSQLLKGARGVSRASSPRAPRQPVRTTEAAVWRPADWSRPSRVRMFGYRRSSSETRAAACPAIRP